MCFTSGAFINSLKLYQQKRNESKEMILNQGLSREISCESSSCIIDTVFEQQTLTDLKL